MGERTQPRSTRIGWKPAGWMGEPDVAPWLRALARHSPDDMPPEGPPGGHGWTSPSLSGVAGITIPFGRHHGAVYSYTDVHPSRVPAQNPPGPAMKRPDSPLDTEASALAVAVSWLLFAQLLAVLAWAAGVLTVQGALVGWLALGVLPPALALWSLPRPAGQPR